MNSIKIRVEYSDNALFQENVNNYWVTLVQQETGNYLAEIMLIKVLEIEMDAPKRFGDKNHPAKYKLDFKNTGNGSFFCTLQKKTLNKHIFSLIQRCIERAWDKWNNRHFTGVDFGFEVEEARKSWFPAENNIPSGDMSLVLKTTRVQKTIV